MSEQNPKQNIIRFPLSRRERRRRLLDSKDARIPVSYTHLDVYKRQILDIP